MVGTYKTWFKYSPVEGIQSVFRGRIKVRVMVRVWGRVRIRSRVSVQG